MRRFIPAILCLALVAAAPTAALAGGNNTPNYSQIKRGKVDIGFLDNLLILRSNKSSDDWYSGTYFAYMGGLTPRVFVNDNLSIGANLNLFVQYQKAGQGDFVSKGWGFLGFFIVHYHVAIQNNFFWKPGIGGGGYYGQSSTPLEDSNAFVRSRMYGGAVRIDMGFLYFVSKRINVRGGPEAVIRFGEEAPGSGETRQNVSLDAGFSVGFGYVF